MTLKYDFVTVPEYHKENDENGLRHYIVDNEKYISITTLLSKLSEDDIQAWRDRIGHEEADRKTALAADTGEKVHDCCEKYLLNQPIPKYPYSIQYLFNFIKPELDKINRIKLIEKPLVHKKLKVAGTTDCIGYYENELSVIDHKTTTKPKRIEWIDHYFIQECFYSLCYYDYFGILPTKLVILMAGNEGKQVFIQNTKDWIPTTIKTIKELKNDRKSSNGAFTQLN